MLSVNINKTGNYLTLKNANRSTKLHAIWLRDNAWDEKTRSPENSQRLITPVSYTHLTLPTKA